MRIVSDDTRNFKNLQILLPKGTDKAETSKALLTDLLSYLSPVPVRNDVLSPSSASAASATSELSPPSFEEDLEEIAPVETPGYDLMHKMASGSFGDIYLAKHSLTGQAVAIKHIQKTKVSDEELAQKLVNEIMIQKSLHHPHICPVLQVIDRQQNVYLVLEYCEGGDLFTYIEKHGKFDEESARAKFRQLLSAVEYCHRNNIAHRDIKPENVLLDKRENIKLIDFGLATMFTSEKTVQGFTGSFEYASPELVARLPYQGPEVDIWALGVTLYVMICGTLPFQHTHLPKLFGLIVSAAVKYPDFASPALVRLLKGMFQADASRRFRMEDVLRHEWVMTGFNALPTMIEVGENVLDMDRGRVDDDIMDQLILLGFQRVDVEAAVQEKEPSAVYAAYRLLLAQREVKSASKVSKNVRQIPRLLPREKKPEFVGSTGAYVTTPLTSSGPRIKSSLVKRFLKED